VVAIHVMVGSVWPGLLSWTNESLAAYLVALVVLTALVEPHVRRAATWFVDRVVLRRVDYTHALSALEAELLQITDDQLVLERAATRLGAAVVATTMTVIEVSTTPPQQDTRDDDRARPLPAETREDDGAATRKARMPLVVKIPTVDSPRFAWRIEALSGGRRLLSDEFAFLTSAAASTGRRLDALRVARERLLVAVREQQMGRLASEAELRALRAQINPHFLFNALTTIGYLVRESPQKAIDTLMRLTSLLRAVLHRSRAEFTTLGDEVDLIQAYLEIEQARFEERLRVTIDVPVALRAARVPALLLQPLVENAVKHGIGPVAAGGHVWVEARQESDDHGSCLRLIVRDSGAGSSTHALRKGRARGVGLSNVESRLHAYFGDRGKLVLDAEAGSRTIVAVVLPLDVPVAPPELPETVH
jgi:two-component sensor histidine kinase